ncbi:MAG: DUF58 domain-containing protein [Planctomycetes bacterium]|nr:DUF58 domain-containing protein [Planctomycetota bacterium]
MPSLFRRPTAPAPASGARETLAEVLAEVRAVELQPGRLVTDVLSGGFRSSFRGGGVEFSDVREYVEGDDPRAVDWNVTARLGRPFVKRFVEERERTLVFALDLGAGMAAGLGAWSARQGVVRLAACLASMAIDNHDRVGFVAADAARGVVRFVPPKKGAGHVLRIARDLVELPLGSGGAAVDTLLAQVAGRVRRKAVVFVLSDFAGAEPLRTLRTCARRHDLVAVRALPHELLAPPPALLAVRDPVTGAKGVVDFAAAPVRAAWAARVHAWRAARDDEFGRAGADRIDLELPMHADLDAVVQPLLAFFRRRAGWGGR